MASLFHHRASLASRLAMLAAGMAVSVACGGITDLLPKGGGGTAKPSPPTPPPPAQPGPPAPSPLGTSALVRRLYLDLSRRPPSAQDLALAKASPKNLPAIVDALLNDGAFSPALAALHPRMWHLDSNYLPDLDRYASAGDKTLTSALTAAARQKIIEEPAAMVRWIVDQKLPYTMMFSAGYGLATSNLLALWGLSDDGNAYTGESLHFTSSTDGRPLAGLLSSFGLNAALGGSGEPQSRQRTTRLLNELVCLNLDDPAAHDFNDLTPDELKSDLATLAANRTPCATCHLQFEAASQALGTANTGKTFQEWLAYTAPSPPPQGAYAGRSFNGVAGLVSLIGADPRAHRCEIGKLLNALYQRPVGAGDNSTLAQALNDFYENGDDLQAATRHLVLSADYAYGPIGTNIKGDYLRQSSGVRLLGKAQWQGIATFLAPSANSLLISDDLDPGHDEALSSDSAMPSGAYFHAVDALARNLATAVINVELADASLAGNRRLFSELPDGAGLGATTTQINDQIKHLWNLLVGVTPGDSDQVFLDLQAVWTGAQPSAIAADSRRAWRAVLVAILSHPDFLIY